MRKILLLSALITTTLWATSCKNDDDNTNENRIDVLYTDISPDKELQTVLEFTESPIPLDCNDIPTPTDSTTIYDVDLNQDEITDFTIKVAHNEFLDEYCGHCRVFTYSIIISSSNSNNLIAANNENLLVSKLFPQNSEIDIDNVWSNQAYYILMQQGCALPFQQDFSDGFIGVKMMNNIGYIQVAKLPHFGIAIKTLGYNNIENNSLTAISAE